MKIVFSDKKSGRTSQLDIPKDSESILIGKRIGEIIEGTAFGLEGFKLQITGLSDAMGTPSRKEVEGSRKAYLLLDRGVGIIGTRKGKRIRKQIRGNSISVETMQVNTVITEYGPKNLEELFPKKEKKVEAKEQAAN